MIKREFCFFLIIYLSYKVLVRLLKQKFILIAFLIRNRIDRHEVLALEALVYTCKL